MLLNITQAQQLDSNLKHITSGIQINSIQHPHYCLTDDTLYHISTHRQLVIHESY
jgi:hypothetical protein